MTWAASTVDVTYRNGADNPVRQHAGHANAYGLHVFKERSSWQICSPEGLCVKGLIPTRKAARALADTIGPMAPNGWNAEAVKRWRSDDPTGYGEMAALLR
jgi:hypothetical protein